MQDNRPDWLPDLANVSGTSNDVIQRLQRLFIQDFQQTERLFMGIPVWWDRSVGASSPFERGFLHLITRAHPKTKVRTLDRPRAERLPWLAPLLENASDPGILVWDYREGHGRIRTYVWLVRFDYVAVLEMRSMDRGAVAILVTAYYLDGPSMRKTYRRKYDQRLL